MEELCLLDSLEKSKDLKGFIDSPPERKKIWAEIFESKKAIKNKVLFVSLFLFSRYPI